MGYVPNIRISDEAHKKLNILGRTAKAEQGKTQHQVVIELLEKAINEAYNELIKREARKVNRE
ncbi:MAG: hypothetical protein DRI61_11330 [Chloroflexi bacterium]|nr:MAG: hypothetical protein DRI61_11330 [Chloroflexota bacterium]